MELFGDARSQFVVHLGYHALIMAKLLLPKALENQKVAHFESAFSDTSPPKACEACMFLLKSRSEWRIIIQFLAKHKQIRSNF